MEPMEQDYNKKVDDNKNIRVYIVKSKQIIITITNLISINGKLLIMLTKMILLKDK